MDEDGLPVQHPPDDLPVALGAVDAQGDVPLVIGVAGPHDGHREPFLPVLAHEERLAGDLVPGVGPVGVGQGRALGDAVPRRRLVVGGSGADEDILPGLPPKQPPVPFRLVRRKADEFADHVEGHILQPFGHRRFVADVGDDLMDAGGRPVAPVPPVQEPHLPAALLTEPPDHAGTDGPGPADEQSFSHMGLLHGNRYIHYNFFVRPMSTICLSDKRKPLRRGDRLFLQSFL